MSTENENMIFAKVKTMKVYKPTAADQERHPLYVSPGATEKNVSQWIGPDDKPLLITVEFRFGVATVEENLGKYLINHGLAQRNKLLLPA